MAGLGGDHGLRAIDIDADAGRVDASAAEVVNELGVASPCHNHT